MQRNVIETVMGAVVLLVAVVFVVFAFRSAGLSSTGGYEVNAQFDDASGLAIGTDVRMAGVKVGTVSGQRLDPENFKASVTLQVDKGIMLPTDSSARIIPDGLLGGNFVALEPGAEDDSIQPGGRIEFTQGAINVVDLIARFMFNTADDDESSKTQ
jgi:phospholipid/cholesterol/gamma-HCH transport system substrate-binding protein